ncbi:hypothetical protein QQS21_003579 [Conoideocrella luteorostrata]|uniref:Uncharacterized protein n=1 Tax=Conoideocrella luteorostrata TaxID=1105319 RepID=A0AAJ0CT83_9HYPO|nr:hypothetical protein QQS21_003579 [Conoideocrella luteorostrata]
MPSIDVRVSAQSDVLDLNCAGPFIIALNVVLNHSSPITFPHSESALTNGAILRRAYSSFRDIHSGQFVERNHIQICYSGDPVILQRDNQGDFTTLYAGQNHTIDQAIERVETKRGEAIVATPRMTSEEYREVDSKRPTVWKWYFTRGLQDGKTYEIGLDEFMCIEMCLKAVRRGFYKDHFLSGTKMLCQRKSITIRAT